MHSLRLLAIGLLAFVTASTPAPRFVKVRHPPGSLHGFLAVRALDGSTVGDGDLVQTITGDRVTGRTTFRLRDGSVNDETAVFSIHGSFHLLNYHLVQRGPAFEHPLTLDIDMSTGKVAVHTQDDHGAVKVDEQTMKLPPDLANGLMITLLENVTSEDLPLDVPMIVATPGVRLVKLVVTNAGPAPFATGRTKRSAIDYLVKTEIGGVAGLVAPLVGKSPPEVHVWILPGEAPAFVKSEAPLTVGTPILRTELVSPEWPR
jgi:hypothetical protein